jgi:MFS family permease
MFRNYSKNFWVLAFSMFLFMTSFNLVIPELNNFITDLGGADYKGLVISIFTISAGIARPFSGKLADTIGRKKVMLIGIIVCMLVSLLYPLSFSIWFFLLLRFIHGFSVGFQPTGATALVTDILPEDRRGMGMGIWGTFISLGIGVGQVTGSYIYKEIGINNLFLIASLTAVLSGILVMFVEETLEKRVRFTPKLLKIKGEDVLEPSVLPSAIVMFLTATCSGIIFVITPDMSGYLGSDNKGLFFGYYVVSTIIVRLFSARLSDKIGRRKTMIIGFSLLLISMLLIGFSRDLTSYIVSSIIFGFATGISSPTLFAWTADLSHPERRGVGAGTMFIALEAGIMVGSASTHLTYHNTLNSVPLPFITGSFMALLSIVYLIWHLKFRQSKT